MSWSAPKPPRFEKPSASNLVFELEIWRSWLESSSGIFGWSTLQSELDGCAIKIKDCWVAHFVSFINDLPLDDFRAGEAFKWFEIPDLISTAFSSITLSNFWILTKLEFKRSPGRFPQCCIIDDLDTIGIEDIATPAINLFSPVDLILVNISGDSSDFKSQRSKQQDLRVWCVGKSKSLRKRM